MTLVGARPGRGFVAAQSVQAASLPRAYTGLIQPAHGLRPVVAELEELCDRVPGKGF